MAAPTYIPNNRRGWWGGPDLRVRCCKDDKVVFADESAAARSAAKVRGRGEATMHAYRGRCGHWHVGHRYGAP